MPRHVALDMTEFDAHGLLVLILFPFSLITFEVLIECTAMI